MSAGSLATSGATPMAMLVAGDIKGASLIPTPAARSYLGEDGERLLSADFKKVKLSEILGARNGDESAKLRRALYSALWQADGQKTRRFAPVEFIGRYMPDFFDYAIADEVHELKGDTAQGNALGTLAACAATHGGSDRDAAGRLR